MHARYTLLVMLIAGCSQQPPPAPPAPPPGGALVLEPDTDYERMPKPQPGDWLHRFQEEPQTYEEYVGRCANRRATGRETIYLQPFGTLAERTERALALIREYCEIFFGTPCVIQKPIPLPEDAFVLPRRQYNSTMLIEHLVANALPKDALAVAGITDDDLFSRGLNFVFGEGSLEERAGVYSLHRFGSDWPLFLDRAFKLVTHELGHVLSIRHCVAYKCVMSGANSLSESDRYPLHPCPTDLRKLEWNLGFDRMARYAKLESFYRKIGFEAEAGWVTRHVAALRRP